jgi:hexosaminidase
MTAPLLQSGAVRAQQLGELGSAGLEALDHLAKNQSAPSGWKQSKLSLIESAKKPDGMVRFTVLEPMQQLVNAVP